MRTVPNQQNQRNTRQRRVILEELRMAKSHPTAAELYQVVRRRLPRVSLGTIYRNLEILAQSETICKLEMGGSEVRFDGETRPHHHARCIECGTISDFFGVPEEVVQPKHMNPGDYDIHGYHIEFYGLCPPCKSKQATEETRNTQLYERYSNTRRRMIP